MVAQRRRAVIVVGSVILGLFGMVASCSKVPLLAPTGSVITLIPEITSMSLNSQATIIATVIENGIATQGGSGSGGTTASRTGAGTPVQNGTHVTFTTSLGQIQPSDAITHNGETQVTFITGGSSGTATITAYSGGASASIQLKVGTAAVKTVNLTAAPQTLGAAGGAATVIANVTDDGGSPIGGVLVDFTTDHGTITPSAIQTDASGNATAVLSTNATAKITATAGTVVSTAVTVTVNARGLSGFTASPSSTTAGSPITFTTTPTQGANVSNVHIDFGDGSAIDLGAISASTTTSHAYLAAGIYTATATSSDATGSGLPLATQVIVGALPVTLSASPNPTATDTPTTFTVTGTSTAAVDHYQWTWDDGTPSFATSSPQTTHVFTSRGTKTVRVDVIGVGGGLLGSAPFSMTVQ
jgi:hypothetical protein